MLVRLRGNLHELLDVWLVVRWKCYATQPTRRGPATTATEDVAYKRYRIILRRKRLMFKR